MDIAGATSSIATTSSNLQSKIGMAVMVRTQQEQKEQADALLGMIQDSARITAAAGHVDLYA